VSGSPDIGEFPSFRRDHVLYRRVLDCHIGEGEVVKAHCPTEQWKEGLSCDWSEVTPPELATRRANHILLFTVGHCQDLGVDVRHSPIADPCDPDYNLAHCLLFLPDEILCDKRRLNERRNRFLRGCVLKPWPT